MKAEFDKMTVRELADGIRSQKYKSEEVVRFFAEKCEKNAKFNAIIEVFESAQN